jgi:hypothetical protein
MTYNDKGIHLVYIIHDLLDSYCTILLDNSLELDETRLALWPSLVIAMKINHTQ